MSDSLKGCLFNLLIYTEEERRTHYFREIVHSFIEKFPCRVIFLQKDDELKKEKTNVSGSCDQIQIQAKAEQLPFMVLTHLVPDLPIFLLWGQDPTIKTPVMQELMNIATKVVYDADCVKELQPFSEEMLEFLDKLHLDVMDINWAMIKGWRDVTARVFDSEEKVARLRNCEKLTITYNETTTEGILRDDIQASYFQAWIGSRMGWKVKEARDSEIEYDQCTVFLQKGKDSNRPSGAILELDVVCAEKHRFHLVQAEKGSKVTVHVSSEQSCDLPFSLPIPNLQRGLALLKEIFYHHAGPHYRKALEILSNTKGLK